MGILDFLNQYSNLVTALSTVVLACLTWVLVGVGKRQAEVAAAIRDIEKQREAAEDPVVYLFFHGYDADRFAHFTLQNSGKRNLFLSSLRVSVPNGQVNAIKVGRPDGSLLGGDVQRDVVVSTTDPLGVVFRLKDQATGLHFDVVFQPYTGNPAIVHVDPSTMSGYVIRHRGSTQLEVTHPAGATRV